MKVYSRRCPNILPTSMPVLRHSTCCCHRTKYILNSQMWEGQFIEIANIESKKSLIIGNVYRPPNNTNSLYQDFTNEFIPILQRANCETIIAGDFNIDLLKINNNATLGNYFNSVIAQSFFPLITLPTRFSDHNCTLIDNFLCKLKRSYLPSTSGILVSRISDHLPYFTFFYLSTFNPFYTRHMASKYTHVTRTFGGKSMLQKINPPTAFQILFPRIFHCLHAIVIHQMKDKECSISNI